MADPAATENFKERQNHIALATVRATADGQIGAHHARAMWGQAYAQQALILGEADSDSSTTLNVAAIESQATGLSASASAAVTTNDAYYVGQARLVTAGHQVAVLAAEAANEVRGTNASADAASRTIASEASIRASLQASLASLSASTTASEAAIRASTLTQVALARGGGSVQEANVRAKGITDQAAIQVSRTQRDSVTDANATRLIAAAEAGATTAIASLRAGEIGATTAWGVYEIANAASIRATETATTAGHESREIAQTASIRVAGGHRVTAIQANYQASSASRDAALRRYTADKDHLASRNDTDQRYAEEVFAADKSKASALYKADNDYASDVYVADLNLRSTKYESTNDYNSRVAQANTRAAADNYDADQRYQSVVVHEAAENSRLLTKLNYADAHWRMAWDLVKGLSDPGVTPTVTTPGFQRSIPRVTTGATLSPSLVQCQVNRAVAASDLESHDAYLRLRDDAAGRGIGAHSPAVAGARLAIQSKGLREAQEKATEARVSAAKANAEAILKGQQSRSSAFMEQQRAYVASESNAIQLAVGITESSFRILVGLL